MQQLMHNTKSPNDVEWWEDSLLRLVLLDTWHLHRDAPWTILVTQHRMSAISIIAKWSPSICQLRKLADCAAGCSSGNRQT